MASSLASIFFVFVCIGCQHALAAPCTIQEITSCMEGFAEIDITDIDKSCGMILKMTECFETLPSKCDVDPQMQAKIDEGKATIDNAKAMCKGSGSSGSSCSITEMTACMAGLDTLSGFGPESCKKVTEVQKCLEDLKNKCGNEQMKQAIKDSMKGFEGICGGAAGCSLADKAKCVTPLSMLKDKKPTANMCKVTKEAVECLEKMKSKCDGDMKKQIIKDMSSFTGSWDEECCNSLVKMNQECSSEEFDKDKFEVKEDGCMKLEASYTCAKVHAPNCKEGPMHKGMSEAIMEMGTKLNECKQKGCNITVPVGKDNNSGVAVMHSIALLVSTFVLGLFTFSF